MIYHTKIKLNLYNMAQDSKIEWTHHTANLWWGCVEVHTGCDHCYARTLSNRWGFDVWGNDKPRRLVNNVFNDIAKFQRLAAAKNEVHRVFVGSMMDIFEKSFPLVDSKGIPVTPTSCVFYTTGMKLLSGLHPSVCRRISIIRRRSGKHCSSTSPGRNKVNIQLADEGAKRHTSICPAVEEENIDETIV